jgi:CubicO group peptidase (beta-lactamase class C family)
VAHGVWEPGFAEVATGLDTVVREHGEGGAAVAVYHRGRLVVDAWTGVRDESGTPWTPETLVMAFSTTKGVTSTLLHQCVDRGLLDYDDPVAEHWPEFAVNGKAAITVRQVLCHQAGLYDVTQIAADAAELYDWERMVAGVASMTPAFEPGSVTAYHALTFGWLVGGLIERVAGRTFRDVLATELVEPLALDGCFIGVPPSELARVAGLFHGRLRAELQRDPAEMVSVARDLGFTVHPDLIAAALPAWAADPDVADAVEQPLPAGNGCFTARSLGRLYAALAAGGSIDGVRVLSAETLTRATEVQSDRADLVLALPIDWRLGYHGVITSAGVLPGGFGHSGLGGSGAFADRERDLAVAFLPNGLGGLIAGDARLMEIGGAAVRCADQA